MNKLVAFLVTGIFFGCSQHTVTTQTSSSAIDSLAAQVQELKEMYRPGLGEIMGGIQTHHAKLWFAGINSNWKLADYEIKEIKERLAEAAGIETNRPEVKDIPMMYPAIDSVANAIKEQNIQTFKAGFQSLTNACNNCHRAINFQFNVITVPTAPPVTNQDFKAK
jgi:archaellum component FlaC